MAFPHDDDDDDDEEGTAVLSTRDLVIPPTEALHPFLVFIVGDTPGRMVRVDGDVVCGRGADANVRLTGEGVSRRHTRVYEKHGGTWVEDLGSTNGTLVNGHRITGATRLADGDRIQIGATFLLKFSLQDELDQRLQEELLDAALRDPLTTVHNRRALLDRLDSDLAHSDRHGDPLCLLMLDLDHFKQVNDTFGHLAGDYVLRSFAQLVSGLVRREDFFARYGGEEFAVVCRSTRLADAMVLAERIRAATSSFLFTQGADRIPVSTSIGAAEFVRGESWEALVQGADAALYRAKRAGRNRVSTRPLATESPDE